MSNQKLFLSLLAVAIFIVVVILVPRIFKTPEPIITGESGLVTIEPVIWTDPDKPMQSGYLEESEVPDNAIAITITEEGFFPESFEVKKGKKIVLALTSEDKWSHILKFQDEELIEIAVAVGTGKTSAITFYAPDEPGEYVFYCDISGHVTRGEHGKMIVK